MANSGPNHKPIQGNSSKFELIRNEIDWYGGTVSRENGANSLQPPPLLIILKRAGGKRRRKGRGGREGHERVFSRNLPLYPIEIYYCMSIDTSPLVKVYYSMG